MMRPRILLLSSTRWRLHGRLARYSVVVLSGRAHVARVAQALEGAPEGRRPPVVTGICRMLLAHVGSLSDEIARVERELRQRALEDETAKRLMTIPGIGVIDATAMQALAPPPETFAKGRDITAWLGLVPRQGSSGGKLRLGGTSKMGQRDLRRLLICGAVALVRWAVRKGPLAGSWLARMLARKPKLVVAVALANKNARIAWALMAKGGVYRVPDEVGV